MSFYPQHPTADGDRSAPGYTALCAGPAARRLPGRSGYLAGGLVAGLMLAGCSTGKITSVQTLSDGSAPQPAIVYVADFELAPGSLRSETPTAALPLHAYLEQEKAQSLIPAMSEAIVQDLTRKGIAAERLPVNSPPPKQGWLVRGVFLRVDEGDRLKRALIGFGSGQTDIEVATATDDLSSGTPMPLYQAQADAASNKLPGAAVTLNPYAAAAKFVLAGRDLDHGARDTAEKIADEVAARMKAAGRPA